MIYHITQRTIWQEGLKAGAYQGDTLKTEGFIHCSTREQVVETANRFFLGAKDLFLLEIDPLRVDAAIRYENLEEGSKLFPHIYGVLNLDAVLKIVGFLPGQDGRFSFPASLS